MTDAYRRSANLDYHAGMNVGARIEKARRKAGLTQRALAAGLGVSPTLVCHWEQGSRRPSLERLHLIAELTFTNPAELMLARPSEDYEPPARLPDEIAMLRLFRRMSDRQRQNLLKLLGVSGDVHREVQQERQPA